MNKKIPALLLAFSLAAVACTADDASEVLEAPVDAALIEDEELDNSDDGTSEEHTSEEDTSEEEEMSEEDMNPDQMAATVASDGTTSIEGSALVEQLDSLPQISLSEEEEAGLLYMREEEKLALDVYLAMYDRWDLEIFSNIAVAEQTHTDSVAVLLDRYGLPDPATDTEPGVFVDPDLQALYDDLVASGSQSLTDALLVGALIEDVDIYDLQQLDSDNPAIDLVYSNLERGSRNHMRAFIRQLENEGIEYTPTYLSQEAFDEIVSTPTERGSEGGSGHEGESNDHGDQGGGGHGQGGKGGHGKGGSDS